MANEKRLIDAEALADKVDESKYNNPHPQGVVRANHRNEHDHFLRMILDAPTVDAVEVVRCKDCKYSHDHEINRNYRCHRHARDGYSQVFDTTFTDNDFCSYGERREGE